MDENSLVEIHARKLRIIDWVLQLRDNQILNQIEALAETNSDWRDGLPKEDVGSVEKGISQVKSGKKLSNDEAKKKFAKWI